jgi:glycosyltransferase involved in cell wall biosynthesis
MIVKNEEAVLGRCLDSVKDAVDEIIIVDTGSSDKTKEIARRYTDKVLDFAWIDDFSAARNYSFEQATMDFQMWLDADDIIPESELKKLIKLKNELAPDVDMVAMKYHTHFDENGVPILTSTRERLLRTSKKFRWQDPVHECIPLCGNVLYSDIAVWHKKPPKTEVSTRNLDIYEALEAQGKPFSPRQIYYFARELKDHGRYAKAAYYFEKFLDGKQGWAEDNIATCFNLSFCYQKLNDEQKVLPVLLKSFAFGGPRAEICCEIGYYYKRKAYYQTALEWFKIAANLENTNTRGFVLEDYRGYIPNIECCVCCCFLKRFAEAKEYNKRAGAFKPDSKAVKHNEEYLAALI